MVPGGVLLLWEGEAVQCGDEGIKEIGLGSGEGMVGRGNRKLSYGGAPANWPTLLLGVVS